MCIRDRGRTIQRIADETGVAIMTTPVDTYAAGKLISQCAPISYYMTVSYTHLDVYKRQGLSSHGAR